MNHALEIRKHFPRLIVGDSSACLEGNLHLLVYQFEIDQILSLSCD
jgi:hypothetical protein